MAVVRHSESFRIMTHPSVNTLRRLGRGRIGEQSGEGAAVGVAQDQGSGQLHVELGPAMCYSEKLQARAVINGAVPCPTIAEHGDFPGGHHFDGGTDAADRLAFGVARIGCDAPSGEQKGGGFRPGHSDRRR